MIEVCSLDHYKPIFQPGPFYYSNTLIQLISLMRLNSEFTRLANLSVAFVTLCLSFALCLRPEFMIPEILANRLDAIRQD